MLLPQSVTHRLRRRDSDESGQVLLLTAVLLTMFLVVAALVVDVGHAMLVQRQLQAGVDAAALAAVQELPNVPKTTLVAHQYSPTPTKKNAVNTVGNAVTTVEVKCISGIPGCTRRDGGVNGVVVSATSTVPTFFGRIAGIDFLKVSAKATACAPCSVKPLDVMIVLDRTGSMCAPVACSGGNLSDLHNAQEGIKTFLGFLDPSLDRVGLALTPPVVAPNMISNCGDPVGSGYKPWTGGTNPNVPAGDPDRNMNGRHYGYDAYWPRYVPDPLGSDPASYTVASMEGAGTNPNPGGALTYYLVNINGTYYVNDGSNGTNGQSAFVQRLNCTSGNGNTSYALALEEAQYELVDHGRSNVENVIIFLSDGAANTSPQNVNTGHWTSDGPTGWILRPCGAGVESAKRIKAAGTVIYTIGYDLDAGAGAPEQCKQPDANGHNTTGINETGCGSAPSGWGDGSANPCNAEAAIKTMATDAQHFYKKPDPGELNTIFTQIALDLAGSRGRLVDSTNPNLLP